MTIGGHIDGRSQSQSIESIAANTVPQFNVFLRRTTVQWNIKENPDPLFHAVRTQE